jgi:hypothetical protein
MTILLFIENGKILQIHAYPWEERDNIGWIPYMGRKTYIMKNLSERYIFDSLEEFKAEVKDRFK